MFDVYLRNFKDVLSAPIVSLISNLSAKKVHPNSITLISGVFGLVSVYFSAFNASGCAFLFWFLNRFFDGVDGAYARDEPRTSSFGGYLDILIDFTIYGLIPVAVTAGS